MTKPQDSVARGGSIVLGRAVAILLFLALSQSLHGVARAQVGGHRVSVDGITVSYPDDWTATSYPSYAKLFKLPAGASAVPTDPAELADLPQLTVTTETRRDHGEAVRRLRDLSGAENVTAQALEIGGWPAVQVQYVTARAQPSHGDPLGSETVLVVRTAVAVASTLLRLEALLPPDAADALIEQVRGIGTGLVFAAGGDPASTEVEVQQLQQSLETPSKSSIEGGALAAGVDLEPLSSAAIEAAAQSGASVSVSSEGSPDAELEIAVSGNGRDIVIGSNGTWYYSGDGGQTWAATSVNGNDPSVAWGQSGGSRGTFYAGNITIPAAPASGFTSIQVSTNGGANWSAATPAYTCGQNGDAQCATSLQGVFFPDQEHIAVDRWNVTAGGDQVYSTWRHQLSGGWGIVCSTDSANTWSANTYVSGPGDLPRIAVGANGYVYVVYLDSGNIMLDKFRSCETQSDPMSNELFFPVVVRANVVDVACPMPGLNRCNNGNRLLSPVVAVDDTDSSHIYVAYANNTNPGDGTTCLNQNLCNEDVIVQDSLNGGSSWPASDPTDFCFAGLCFNSGALCTSNSDCFDADRTVRISSGVTARRFMPWLCSVGGDAYVSWYDRRAAFPGGTTISNNSLTDYFSAKAFRDPLGALASGPEFQVNETGTADPQCEGGFALGSGNSWPNGTRAMADSDSCSAQPQNAGFCCQPGDIDGAGRCQQAMSAQVSSLNRCDFDNSPGSVACPGPETCTVASGFPKYGDYNGNACGVGRLYTTWASSVAPPSLPAATDIDSFFSSKIVCCVPQVQVPANLNFGAVCGTEAQTAALQVCNTGKEDLDVSSITSDDPQFAVTAPLSGYPVTISPDFCFPFEATFTPDGSGDSTATLTVNSNDPVNPSLAVAVAGSVDAPDINVAIANSGDFGNVCQGDHADLDITLFNQGHCDLNISSITLTGPDAGAFSLPDDLELPLVLSHDAEFTLPIRFAPGACTDATLHATVQIDSDSPGESSVSVDVSGRSECPHLVIDPGSLSGLHAFPATVVDSTGTLGCYAERTAVLRNTGLCPLTIDDISTAGPDFTVVAPSVFPIVLPGGEETLEATVRFTPQSDADPLAPGALTDVLTVSSSNPAASTDADLCGESARQSGVRILVTDVSSGDPVPVDELDSLTIQSKGKNKPGPINLMFTDLAPTSTSICGNTVAYHVNLETLPATSTNGGNGKSSYVANAKEGNLQTTDSFGLGQCEFREAQLQLQSSTSSMCLLLAKGDSCSLDSECCSGKCNGPSGGKSCK